MAEANHEDGTEQVAFMDDAADALDRMTLSERLRNPAWSTASSDERQLDVTTTLADMAKAAAIIDAAKEVVDYHRNHTAYERHITLVQLQKAVEAAGYRTLAPNFNNGERPWDTTVRTNRHRK
jgi:ABC-type branched-subunit amino acid transport system ATPase component